MTDQEEEIQFESTKEGYAYSVTISQTAYGARVAVNVHNDNIDNAMNHALYMYSHIRGELVNKGFKVAPEEPVIRSSNKKGGDNEAQ